MQYNTARLAIFTKIEGNTSYYYILLFEISRAEMLKHYNKPFKSSKPFKPISLFFNCKF